MHKVERGDTIRITAVFTNPDTNEPVDPTNPTCEVYDPDGTEQLSGAMSGSNGTYQAECQTEFTDPLGYWEVRVYGTYGSKRGLNAERIKLVEII